MAYTASEFHKDLAIFSAGGLLGPTRTRKMLAYAGRKGIQLAGMGARAVLPSAAGTLPVVPAAVQSATPYAVGAGLGAAALQTQTGQDLLAAAAEHGRQSRILFERAQQELMTTPQRIEAAIGATGAGGTISRADIRPAVRKRAVSSFNKAVSKGMNVVKKAKTYGGKGKIKPAKKAFSMVVKLASAKKKKKKAPKRGIRRSIWNAMGRLS
jgi:hypothetical protein